MACLQLLGCAPGAVRSHARPVVEPPFGSGFTTFVGRDGHYLAISPTGPTAVFTFWNSDLEFHVPACEAAVDCLDTAWGAFAVLQSEQALSIGRWRLTAQADAARPGVVLVAASADACPVGCYRYAIRGERLIEIEWIDGSFGSEADDSPFIASGEGFSLKPAPEQPKR